MATALLGYTDSALLDEVVDAFAGQDGATVFQVIDRVVEGGHDPRRFVTDLLERLRDLVILATVPDAGEKGLIDAPADRVAVMQAQAERFGAADLSRAADIVNTGLTEMRGNAAPRLQLELICARVMLPGAYQDELSLMARVDKLERRATLGAGRGLRGWRRPSRRLRLLRPPCLSRPPCLLRRPSRCRCRLRFRRFSLRRFRRRRCRVSRCRLRRPHLSSPPPAPGRSRAASPPPGRRRPAAPPRRPHPHPRLPRHPSSRRSNRSSSPSSRRSRRRRARRASRVPLRCASCGRRCWRR